MDFVGLTYKLGMVLPITFLVGFIRKSNPKSEMHRTFSIHLDIDPIVNLNISVAWLRLIFKNIMLYTTGVWSKIIDLHIISMIFKNVLTF